jgi:predicted transcriptional regulator
MVQPRKKPKKKTADPDKARVSVSFPVAHYQKLQTLAESKKVSLAWVVRDAVDKYLASETQ